MASKRKPLSKKLRFEVFKRDGFTCQYCGRMAPDVILEVDHINPVANGGDNDIMNLITSCRDCNRGKGKKTLSNKDEIKLQQEQLKELSDRREQLQMMIDWRSELEKVSDMEVDAVEAEFCSVTDHSFTDVGRNKIAKLIKKYGVNQVCDAAKIYVDSYYDSESDKFTKSFETIGGICYNMERQKKDPSIYWVNKIAYNVNFKYPHVEKWKVRNIISGKIKTENQFNEILDMVNNSSMWCELKEDLIEVVGCQQ